MPPGPSPVQRSSLREQIADALRDEMLTGRLPAGGRFTVKEIAELYEVSATPVREALIDLAAQGLVEIEHHRGFQVRRFTLADFEDMVEARTLVVEGVFRKLGDRLGDRGVDCVPEEALASARRRGEASIRASLAGELDVLIGCDLRFWRELTALIGNEHVHAFLDRLRVQAWMFCVPYLRGHPELATVCWSDHTLLVDAIADRDLPLVREIIGTYNHDLLTVMRDLAGRPELPDQQTTERPPAATDTGAGAEGERGTDRGPDPGEGTGTDKGTGLASGTAAGPAFRG